MVGDPTSDAGGPRFESRAGRVTGKPTPSLWRDKHPAIKGLRPPEHHAGKFRQDQKDSAESKNDKIRYTCFESDAVHIYWRICTMFCLASAHAAKIHPRAPIVKIVTRPHSCTDSSVVKDPISDAGGPRFESQAGRVTGKPTPKPLEG